MCGSPRCPLDITLHDCVVLLAALSGYHSTRVVLLAALSDTTLHVWFSSLPSLISLYTCGSPRCLLSDTTLHVWFSSLPSLIPLYMCGSPHCLLSDTTLSSLPSLIPLYMCGPPRCPLWYHSTCVVLLAALSDITLQCGFPCCLLWYHSTRVALLAAFSLIPLYTCSSPRCLLSDTTLSSLPSLISLYMCGPPRCPLWYHSTRVVLLAALSDITLHVWFSLLPSLIPLYMCGSPCCLLFDNYHSTCLALLMHCLALSGLDPGGISTSSFVCS